MRETLGEMFFAMLAALFCGIGAAILLTTRYYPDPSAGQTTTLLQQGFSPALLLVVSLIVPLVILLVGALRDARGGAGQGRRWLVVGAVLLTILALANGTGAIYAFVPAVLCAWATVALSWLSLSADSVPAG